MKRYLTFFFLVAVIIVVAYEALTFFDNNFKYGRMWESPAVRPHEKELLIMEKGVTPFAGGEALYRATRGEDLKSPLKNKDPDSIEQGKNLYFTFCAQCHGKYHDGNGTVGQSFHPLPSDLRSITVQSGVDGVLFKEISYGIPDGRQPPLASTIDVLSRWRIITYIKSLGSR